MEKEKNSKNKNLKKEGLLYIVIKRENRNTY